MDIQKILLQNKIFKISTGVIGVIAIASIATSVILFQQNQKLKNPNLAAQEEVTQAVKAIGAYMLLPNETPTIATISDPSKLKDQAFFAEARAGDKVLIYAQAHKAILWRPSINKVIEVAPLNSTTTP
jgi:hypothetical protein